MKTNQIKRTFFIRYTPTVSGFRLTHSRTGNGKWTDGMDAIPEILRDSFDREVPKTDPDLYAIYADLLAGKKPADISSTGKYHFTVTCKDGRTLKAVGWMSAESAPLKPAPDDVIAAVKANGSNRWKWDELTTSYTSKDADLEPYGHQGVSVLGMSGKTIHCTAHIGKTFAGSDVCLNLKDGQDDERARELYLEQATEIVCGCGVAGEWDGDSWYMSDSVPFTVRLRATPEETAAAIRNGTERALKNLEDELRSADQCLETLAGWRDDKGKDYPEGEPCEGSVSDQLDWKEEEVAA